MRLVSAEVGFQTYERDTTETSLCESETCRTLGLKESYPKGISAFIVDRKGRVLRKKYGRESLWEFLPINKGIGKYKFLNHAIVE